ncbi:MAG: gliding motility-associated C-terminal domain-containing protein [Janthinobacterium lividum]
MKKILYVLSGLLLALAQGAAAQLAPVADSRTLEFIPNQGQWPSYVRYAGTVPGGHLYLEPAGLRYVLLQSIKHPAHGGEPGSSLPHLPPADSLLRGHQVRVQFVGADAGTPLVPATATGEVRNYLHGNDPAHWAHSVPTYRQVRYQAPWPGIGARFYENQRQQLEYDFELAAGANPALVKLKYTGASRLTLSRDGRLHIGTTVGELTELAPQAYQTDSTSGERQPVACHYRLRATDSTVTFELGRYDHRRPLVIDPTVLFSTYTGATGDNWGFTAAYDAAGNMYSGGIVLNYAGALAPNYPTTVGAFQTTFAGVIDIAVIKYNTTVNGPASRVWATFVGGDRQDFPSSLVVNAQNELIILGTTASTNYPTSTTAFQRNFNGGTRADPFGDATIDPIYNVTTGTDIVVTRLNSTGSAIVASTYLGGSGTDGLVPYDRTTTVRQLPQNYGDAFRSDVVTDAAGNIYLASVTSSPNFPITSGSFGAAPKGGSDAVVVKMPPTLSALTWSGYLGGSADDAAYSIQLDASSNVYVTGGTLSPNFPATAGALATQASGDVDGFVARIAASGGSVQRASYLGTSAYDQSFFVQIGADGGVYLLGQTMGAWPVSAGIYSNAGSRQFIQKMSPDLDQRLLSTVFGSGRSTIDISPTAFLVDQCDRIYVCGWGGNGNRSMYTSQAFLFNGYTHGMPVTATAVRATPDTPNAGSDFYLAQFTPGLTQLAYGTYYGDATPGSFGDHVDGGTSRFDPRGVAYAAVCACFDAAGFPVPPGAFTYSTVNGTRGSNCNNAAFKLNFEPQAAMAGGDVTTCINGVPVPLVGMPTGGTWSGPGVTGSVATGYVFTPSAALLGPQVLTYTIRGVITACTATATKTVTVAPLPQVTAPTLPAICANGGALALATGQPAGGTWSGPGVSGSAAGGFVFTPSLALVGIQTLTYSVISAQGCTGQGSTTVQVLSALPITLAADTALCPGSTAAIRLRASVPGGVWSGPGVTASGVFTPPATPGTVSVVYTLGAGSLCPTSATRRITLLPAAVLAAASGPVLCDSLSGRRPLMLVPYTVRFSQPAFAGLPDAVLTWDFGDGSGPATGLSVTHTYTKAGTFQATATVQFNNNRCSAQVVLAPIQVGEMFIPNVFTPNGDQLNEHFAPRIGGCPPHLQIFSRWGQKVYENAAYLNNWDGAGHVPGIYYYLLTIPGGSEVIKGWVELVRQ